MGDPAADEIEPCSRCSSRPSAPTSRPRIGLAFEECWSCGRLLDRPGVTEWDFHLASARRRIVVGRAAFALLGGLVVAGAHLTVALTSPRAWSPREAALAFLVGWFAFGLWESGRLLSEVYRSRRRVLEDPMYRARLLERSLTVGRAAR